MSTKRYIIWYLATYWISFPLIVPWPTALHPHWSPRPSQTHQAICLRPFALCCSLCLKHSNGLFTSFVSLPKCWPPPENPSGNRWAPALDRRPYMAGCTHTYTHTHSHCDHWDVPINLMCTYLGCGRKLEYPEKIHADLGRMWKIHTDGGPGQK